MTEEPEGPIQRQPFRRLATKAYPFGWQAIAMPPAAGA
jgi:hypothetical protein